MDEFFSYPSYDLNLGPMPIREPVIGWPVVGPMSTPGAEHAVVSPIVSKSKQEKDGFWKDKRNATTSKR